MPSGHVGLTSLSYGLKKLGEPSNSCLVCRDWVPLLFEWQPKVCKEFGDCWEWKRLSESWVLLSETPRLTLLGLHPLLYFSVRFWLLFDFLHPLIRVSNQGINPAQTNPNPPRQSCFHPSPSWAPQSANPVEHFGPFLLSCGFLLPAPPALLRVQQHGERSRITPLLRRSPGENRALLSSVKIIFQTASLAPGCCRLLLAGLLKIGLQAGSLMVAGFLQLCEVCPEKTRCD